ncbi:MAG TPA: glutamyl-tRNA reductase [Acidobacteriota bacterium]|nr:glutamyl-tRNA reductase [Acidobacteriota bacterium]
MDLSQTGDDSDLVLVGLSHKTAPIEIREKVSIPEAHLEDVTQRLRESCALPESLILSTCNRVEVVAHSDRPEDSVHSITEFLHQHHSLKPSFLDSFLYRLHGPSAVRHVFRVAASLDSLVIGEAQILGQMKQAYQAARELGSLGRLERLVPQAFFVAKRVRRETQVGMSPVSISSVAVELAEQIFGRLKGKSAMLIGAGNMAELAAQNFRRSGVTTMLVANRTLETAQDLAVRLDGRAIPFDELGGHLVNTDVVLVSTGAPHYILMRKQMEKVLKQRKYRPLFLIDIAVPRNIDPACDDVENLFLYDIDDLQQVVEANMAERLENAREAEEIIDQEVEKFFRRRSSEQVGPMVRELIDLFEDVCLRDFSSLANGMTEQDQQRLEKHLRQSAHRLAHPLITEIKRVAAHDPDRLDEVELVRRAFDLKNE